eukprot:2867217-Lingulodinium_polyedra.AAC.1
MSAGREGSGGATAHCVRLPWAETCAEGTTQPSQEIVVFRWTDAAGSIFDQDVRADHACERGLRLPRFAAGGTF